MWLAVVKKRRDYAQAQRMANNLVVTWLLLEGRRILELSDRVNVRVSDWIAISSGIHIGELGILTVGSPSQLLNSPSSRPPPRQPI